MALSAESVRKVRNLDQQRKGYGTVATSVTIYKGSIVCKRESDGLLLLPTAATGATGRVAVGVSISDTCTGASDGSVVCEFAFGHTELFTAKTALTTTYLNCKVVPYDDDSVTNLSAISSAKQYVIGVTEEFDSNGDAWVRIDPALGSKSVP